MLLMIQGVPKSRPLGPAAVQAFLARCPGEIGMEIIDGPHVVEHGDLVGGYVMIAESHITVHAQPDTVFVDIFSCKAFDTNKARKFTLASLDLYLTVAQFIPRLIPSEA